jgi:hypothetical protein
MLLLSPVVVIHLGKLVQHPSLVEEVAAGLATVRLVVLVVMERLALLAVAVVVVVRLQALVQLMVPEVMVVLVLSELRSTDNEMRSC